MVYIQDKFGKEVIDRVELMVRHFVVNQTETFRMHVLAYEDKALPLIKTPDGFDKTPEEIWQTYVNDLTEVSGKNLSEQSRIDCIVVDEFVGQVFENFYNVLSNEENERLCKQYLSDPRVKALYRIKASNVEEGEA